MRVVTISLSGILLLTLGCASAPNQEESTNEQVSEDSGPSRERVPQENFQPVVLSAPQKEVLLLGGIPVDSQLFHPALRQAMFYKNRTGHRTSNFPIELDDGFVVSVVAWGEGVVRLHKLNLIAVSLSGQKTVVSSNTWQNAEDIIRGGRWGNTSTGWFKNQLEVGENLPFFVRDRGDILLDTRGKPNEVHHVWDKNWPRAKLPPGTRLVGLEAEFGVYGKGACHFILDHYDSVDDGEVIQHGPGTNVWQRIGSPTYDAELGQGQMQSVTILTEVCRK